MQERGRNRLLFPSVQRGMQILPAVNAKAGRVRYVPMAFRTHHRKMKQSFPILQFHSDPSGAPVIYGLFFAVLCCSLPFFTDLFCPLPVQLEMKAERRICPGMNQRFPDLQRVNIEVFHHV